MDELEICRLSAEALEKRDVVVDRDARGVIFLGKHHPEWWNPLTNAEQRWECVEWLIADGYEVNLSVNGEHYLWDAERESGVILTLDCSATEFPARAVAELRRRQK